MKYFISSAIALIAIFCSTALNAQEARWMRYSSISPDGSQIAFSYKGDVYLVASSGGKAWPLTQNPAYDTRPIWSNDGKTIAFASYRYGNSDVFIVPSDGGEPKRLTFHSANDYPTDFSIDDKSVLFSSVRKDDVENMQFPSRVLSELYSISIDGGMPKQILTTPAEDAVYNNDGSKILFQDRKGVENAQRKHHQSSVTRDIWTYTIADGKYTKLTSFQGEDRNPVYASDETVFYLSEREGSFNVFKLNGEESNAVAITKFKEHPIRYLSISKEDQLAFIYNGDVYTSDVEGNTTKLNIIVNADNLENERSFVSVSGNIDEFDVSPDGKEIVYIHRGEVFVSSVDHKFNKRITNTVEQERSVSFSPEGDAILYASERDGSWNVYQSKIVRNKEELSFSTATLLKEEGLIVGEAESFQPKFSPDGKEIAYLEERTTLRVFNIAAGTSRTVLGPDEFYSYRDGDISFEWSKDSKYLVANFTDANKWNDQIALIPADGSKEFVNLSRSGHWAGNPKWSVKGDVVYWESDRDGLVQQSGRGGESDIYAMFLTQEAYDEFLLSEDEFALLEERKGKEEKNEEETSEEKEDKKEKKNKKEKEEEETEEKVEDISIEWDGIYDRVVRLTIHSSVLGGFSLSPDGGNLYYMAKGEKGNDLWKTNLRTKETKIISPLKTNSYGQLVFDDKGDNLFLLANGGITKIDAKSDASTGVSISSEMELKAEQERAHMFEHVWRQAEKKFYLEDLHGVDWPALKENYIQFLPHINNNFDFSNLLSELLGELNASHTGSGYRFSMPQGDETAVLGVFYDNNYQGKGMKIEEVIGGGPLDKKESKVTKGDILEKIDGIELTEKSNLHELLNRKAGEFTLLSLFNPNSGERWDEVVKPISVRSEGGLLYKRWVDNCRAIVEKESNGRIGYVHVKGMNEESYRTVFDEVLGRYADKEALIVDTRFNGGGWLHDKLITFLSGKEYVQFVPRGQKLGAEPKDKWTKPSVVLMSESNYSDAHFFPAAYSSLKIGKTVGMPVPGTATAVWWETLIDPTIYFGIPQVGMVDLDGDLMENKQLEPDYKVPQVPEEIIKGIDQQLIKSVEVLIEGLK